MMLIVDAHEDLAWNMLTFGRDYTLSAAETRRREQGSEAPKQNGDTLLGWPEYQRGQVGLVFSTLFVAPARRRLGEWDSQIYRDFSEANARYRAQLESYHRLVDRHPDRFRLVQTRTDMQDVLNQWKQPSTEEHPVGLVVLMEGAEGVLEPAELAFWWQAGVRLIGPAWIGTRYCGGTREPGPLTPEGYALLDGMAEHGFVLDISHMDEQAAQQALDYYPQAVVATHANAMALLKGLDTNRHLSDQVIRQLVARGGVIGVVPTNAFLKPGWREGDPRQEVTLQHVVAQIDYMCQLAGDAHHVGLGSDFDGGFGLQSVPLEIDNIADLQKLAPLLAEKGYTDAHLAAIFGENWISLLKRTLPDFK
jgi:membrane dipeptidase